jgi:hypothetical protein
VGLSLDPGFPSVFDTGALVSGCDHFCVYLSAARTRGGSGRASGGKACFSSVDRGTRGPSRVRLVFFTGVGASGEDIFQVPLGRLVPEALLSRGYLAVVHLLFAGPTARRGAVFGRLLAPLADVFCEVNDLTTLHGVVATMRVHMAWTAATLPRSWAFVAVALASSRCCGHQSSGPRLLVVVVLLLFLLSVPVDDPRATRLGSSSLWCRVPCMALGGSGALVGQSEERGDSFHIMCGQLLQHFFIMYSLSEGRDDGSIRNTRYRTSHLGEAGDELPEDLPGFLPHRMEVGLHTVLLVSTSKVRNEPHA